MLYNIIYEFLLSQLNSDYLSNFTATILGNSITLAEWLSHTITITLMILGVVWLLFFVRWIFRVFAGLIKI